MRLVALLALSCAVRADPTWDAHAAQAMKAFSSSFIFPGQKNTIVNTAGDTKTAAAYWNIAQAVDTLVDGGAGNAGLIQDVYNYQSGVGWNRDVSPGAGENRVSSSSLPAVGRPAALSSSPSPSATLGLLM